MKKNKLFQKLIGTDQLPTNSYVFNCRDVIFITPIKRLNNHNLLEEKYFFMVYFTGGISIEIGNTSGNTQALNKIRELFVNNIGFSYVTIEEELIDNGTYLTVKQI